MEVNENDMRSRFFQAVYLPVRRVKRVGNGLHKGGALQADDPHLSGAHIQQHAAPTGGRGVVVGRAEQKLVLFQHRVDLPPAQAVVAQGNHIGAAVKNKLGAAGQYAVAHGGVLAVYNG